MIQRIRKIYSLLNNEQRKKLMILQILVVLMAFTEVVGIATIGPFMALVGDIQRLEGEGVLAQIYHSSGMHTPRQFLFWMGVTVMTALTTTSLISMFVTWRLMIYAQQIGAELSIRLYNHYMQQPWLFHSEINSSQLTNKISQETTRVTMVIQALMLVNAKFVLALLIAIGIFLFNPIVALTGLFMFGSAYIILYRAVRNRLTTNGKSVSYNNHLRFKLMNEGFGGIKDTLLLGRQFDFTERFNRSSRDLGYAKGVTAALSQVPRFAIELIALGALIFLILYLLSAYDGNLGDILPVLSVYALAGFKLLPAFQQIYYNLAVVKGNLAAFDSLESDLVASQKTTEKKPSLSENVLYPSESISLENIHFTYPGKENKALDGVNIKIYKNQVIGLVGSSGSGKSTLIDILLGLIKPQKGSVMIDGAIIDSTNLRPWQNSIGFVPQSIFLADASIRENIAFGLSIEKIDDSKVIRAADLAHLSELISELPDGLDTQVGERGIQLSGGQRQRIGIARALYNDAEVLVLDEATSALDGITEKMVMDAINGFTGKKTIIMIAHRLSTVKKSDQIYILENGQVIDQGSYQELVKNNTMFKNMVEHS